MTRLGIVSDSHDHGVWLERYLKLCRREKYDAVFHLGDYDSDARWLERRLESPVIAVAGNCDMFSDLPRMARAAIGRGPGRTEADVAQRKVRKQALPPDNCNCNYPGATNALSMGNTAQYGGSLAC